MKRKKIWIALIIVIVIGAQLIPVELPDVKKDNPADLIKTENVPENVAVILKNACYDCHSNETVYPWYSYVAPVSWLVVRDVKEGRKEVNFSDWKNLKITKKAKALDEIAEEVSEGDMPMFIYPIMHKNAKLSDDDRKLLVDWANHTADKLFEKE